MLRLLSLPDLSAATLAALAQAGARLVQAESHPQGVDAWVILPQQQAGLTFAPLPRRAYELV